MEPNHGDSAPVIVSEDGEPEANPVDADTLEETIDIPDDKVQEPVGVGHFDVKLEN